MLHELLADHREEVKRKSQEAFLERWASGPMEPELARTIDEFLDHLLELLAQEGAVPESESARWAAEQGSQLFSLGFSVTQLVHMYGAVSEAVIHRAGERHVEIPPEELEVLSRLLELTIAESVREYEEKREEDLARREMELIGFLAHELKNALSAASTSFEVIKKATVGLKGRTSDVLDRAMARMRDLVDRALAEVRLGTPSEPVKEHVKIAELLDELGPTFQAKAASSGIRVGMDVEPDLAIESDRQLVLSILSNLVLNALKYTRVGGHVFVHAFRRGDRAVVDVEDECGGLPPGRTEEIFRPFVRRTWHPGVGLGLTITLRAAQTLGGEVRVHDLPGKGCIFTADLPRELPLRAGPDGGAAATGLPPGS